MTLQNLSELFWRKVKFFLLFMLSISILYVVLTKFILKIPVADNNKLLSAIDEFEIVLKQQNKSTEVIKKIHDDISKMEYDIHQVQKQDDIKREIYKVEAIYKDNKMSSKYNFSLQASKILRIYYDTGEEHGSLLHNKKLVSDNLIKCQANI